MGEGESSQGSVLYTKEREAMESELKTASEEYAPAPESPFEGRMQFVSSLRQQSMLSSLAAPSAETCKLSFGIAFAQSNSLNCVSFDEGCRL
ncbi:MAG: hypothetical protein OHK0037_17880 [Elainellaceae cyanobacterium]